jgi:serine/threonine-protein kinase HipA
MNLARRVGIDVAPVEVIECAGRDVLLVERFDRTPVVGERRMMVSALTVLGLDEWGGQMATYPELANEIRKRFTEPKKSLRELFSRVAFNICVGNTDDHARNHSAFWDGSDLSLTPAYDICPQLRSGGEAVQAMAIGADRYKFSRLSGLVAAAPLYHLTPVEGQEIIDHQIEVIRSQWDAAADTARMTQVDRDLLWGRAILNPYCLEKQ